MPSSKLLFGLFTLAVTLFAVITQWRIATASLVNFLSFFTIQSNIMVALCLGYSLLLPSSGIGKFFSKPAVQSAIALYIFTVGLVYNTLLRGLFDLEGMNWIVDNLLHVVDPVLFVIYWYIFTPKIFFKWKLLFYWLIYPFLYTCYTLLRGSIVHWYPYPFLNVDDLGYGKVIVNMIGVVVAVGIVGLIILALNRSLSKRTVIAN